MKTRTLRKVEVKELIFLLKLINLEYPGLRDVTITTSILREIFGVDSSEEELLNLNKTLITIEDYELENRKQENGIIY